MVRFKISAPVLTGASGVAYWVLRIGTDNRLVGSPLILSATKMVSPWRLRVGISALFCALLCSCVNPYIKPTVLNYCPTGSSKYACQKLPETSASLDIVNTSLNDVDTNLDSNTIAGQVVDYTTFGLAAAFGIKATHGTKLSTGARNLAAGAGIAYTGGSLFASKDINALYLSAETSLVCIANRGNGLLGAFDQASSVVDEVRIPPYIQELLDESCDVTKSNLDPQLVSAMKSSKSQLDGAIATVQSLDGSLAVQVNSASINTITTLNAELAAKAPNPQAILNAGAESNAIATNIIGKPEPPKMTASGTQSACAATNGQVNAFKVELDGANTMIASQLNAMGDLKTGCAGAASLPVAPLSVNPSSVTLKQGSFSTLVVLGGRPPFTAAWDKSVSAPTESDISFQVMTGTNLVMISASATAVPNAAAYKLSISDSSVVPSSVEVSIDVVSR
jgi:hypothetical protein